MKKHGSRNADKGGSYGGSPGGAGTFDALLKCLRGVPLAKSGRMKEALEAFEGSLEIDPTLASSWYNKGFVLTAEGQYAEALDAFDKAIEINPRTIHSWNGKGYVLTVLERYQEAVDVFERAIEIDAMHAQPWNGMGNALSGLGRYPDALKAYQRAIELDPKFANPWIGKAILLKIEPGLETAAGHSARQSFCRAVSLDRAHPQKFPIGMPVFLGVAEKLDMPLLTRRLFVEMHKPGDETEYADFVERTDEECATALRILMFIDQDRALSGVEKSLWSGIVTYYHGDPLRAREYFDAVDSEDDTNIAGQYYLLLSLRECMESFAKEEEFALKQARAAGSAPGISADQRYYAGRVFLLAGRSEEALSCFAENAAHLPSLYMQWLCLAGRDDPAAESVLGKILDEESRLVEQGACGYLFPSTFPEIDPSRPDWTSAMQLHVHFSEITDALAGIAGQRGLERFPVYRKIIEHAKGGILRGDSVTVHGTLPWRLASG
jgi:tetratricopeptide (TPR) repeat protein